jgi:hypothetical protein
MSIIKAYNTLSICWLSCTRKYKNAWYSYQDIDDLLTNPAAFQGLPKKMSLCNIALACKPVTELFEAFEVRNSP